MVGDRRAFSRGGGHSEAQELLIGARCGRDQRASRRGDQIATSGFGGCSAARSKNERQRRHANSWCAREILEPRLSGVEKGPSSCWTRGWSNLSPYRPLSVDAPGNLADQAVSPRMTFDERSRPCWRRWGWRSIWWPPSLVTSRAAKKLGRRVRHYVHTDMLERKAHGAQGLGRPAQGHCDGRGSRGRCSRYPDARDLTITDVA